MPPPSPNTGTKTASNCPHHFSFLLQENTPNTVFRLLRDCAGFRGAFVGLACYLVGYLFPLGPYGLRVVLRSWDKLCPGVLGLVTVTHFWRVYGWPGGDLFWISFVAHGLWGAGGCVGPVGLRSFFGVAVDVALLV
ncbi:hypothetical protein RND81_01G003600 [Saponaria officinalis]|uniref:Uncharacterized protein n=1 Tax=Saponaria officinalis TaxID=3572 RepID=A0AAW1NAZ8_SAPOF